MIASIGPLPHQGRSRKAESNAALALWNMGGSGLRQGLQLAKKPRQAQLERKAIDGLIADCAVWSRAVVDARSATDSSQ
jgi:hypothetical protein